MRVFCLVLAGSLSLAACTTAPYTASSPYCDDYARSHSRLYGVHYSITDHLDEMDALRAACMEGRAAP